MNILHTVVVVNKKLEVLHQQASFDVEDIVVGLKDFEFDVDKLLKYGRDHYYLTVKLSIKAIYNKEVV